MSWLIYLVVGILAHSRTLRIYDAGFLPYSDVLRNAAYVLAPNVLLTAPRESLAGVIVLLLFAVLATAAVATWYWAVRTARTTPMESLAVILALTAALAVPVLMSAGLFSNDVYLYHFYGRTIDVHGANPIETPPAAFPNDPHLPWVHWTDLPSSYGPLWLMLSAPLSAIAGDSISAVVVVYRTAALALHLAAAAAIWFTLRRTRPAQAASGTLFYAWNPLVLVEVVGNAHNDVLIALLLVLVIAAAAQRVWGAAAFFLACALMAKPFAALMVPALALYMIHAMPRRRRVKTLAISGAIGVVTILALSLPLWAGAQLIANIGMNPASFGYTNTLWEMLSMSLSAGRLDVVRMACFAGGAFWIITRRWARREVAKTTFALWMLFLLTDAWVWPWYFVPAIALSVFAGNRARTLAVALTAGGLLFWTAWSPPPFSALYDWRALILFSPLLATITWLLVRQPLASRAPTARDDDRMGVRLQTAAG